MVSEKDTDSACPIHIHKLDVLRRSNDLKVKHVEVKQHGIAV